MTIKKKIVSAVAAVIVGAAVLIGAPQGGHGFQRGGFGFEPSGRGFQFMAGYLDLTATQQEQAKVILNAAREAAKPYMSQLRETRKALHDAVTSGQSSADIEALARSQAGAMTELSVIRAKSMADVYALLTPEQKAKAEKLRGNFAQRRQGRRGQGSQQTPQAQ